MHDAGLTKPKLDDKTVTDIRHGDITDNTVPDIGDNTVRDNSTTIKENKDANNELNPLQQVPSNDKPTICGETKDSNMDDSAIQDLSSNISDHGDHVELSDNLMEVNDSSNTSEESVSKLSMEAGAEEAMSDDFGTSLTSVRPVWCLRQDFDIFFAFHI